MVFKDLRIRTKLLIGFITITLLVIASSGLLVHQLGKIAEISREIEEAAGISQAALDFNVENFHTQLEVWEYAFEPNQTRLIAFERHNETLSRLLTKLEKLTAAEEHEKGEANALVPDGAGRIRKIAANLELVRNDWKTNLLPEIEKLRAAGADSNLIAQYKEEVRIAVNANEALFDELNFNMEVDYFVGAQENQVHDLAEHENVILLRFRNTLYGMTGIVALLGLVFSLWISSSITESLRKARDVVIRASKGNMDEKIDIPGQDEVSELLQAIDEMRMNLKGVIEEYQKKLEIEP